MIKSEESARWYSKETIEAAYQAVKESNADYVVIYSWSETDSKGNVYNCNRIKPCKATGISNFISQFTKTIRVLYYDAKKGINYFVR